jgi:O-antigen ligase
MDVTARSRCGDVVALLLLSAWFAFLAFGAMTFMVLVRSKHRFRSLIIVTGLLLMMGLLPTRYWNRMNTITTQNVTDDSVQGRLYFWGVAQQMANSRPLLGVGPFGFQVAYERYDQTNGAYGLNKAVHSMWFGILAEQGYVGLSMLCAILLMALRASGRARSAAKKAHDDELMWFATALQTTLVTVCIGGSFLSYHYVEILWHFIGLSFAVERIALSERVPEAVAVTPQVMRPRLQAYGTS